MQKFQFWVPLALREMVRPSENFPKWVSLAVGDAKHLTMPNAWDAGNLAKKDATNLAGDFWWEYAMIKTILILYNNFKASLEIKRKIGQWSVSMLAMFWDAEYKADLINRMMLDCFRYLTPLSLRRTGLDWRPDAWASEGGRWSGRWFHLAARRERFGWVLGVLGSAKIGEIRCVKND